MEALEIPDGTEISASLGQMYEEGWERDYTVIEELPLKQEAPEENLSRRGPRISAAFAAISDELLDSDQRKITLKIVLDSIKIHIVHQVEFHTEDHDVRRHRWEKRQPRF